MHHLLKHQNKCFHCHLFWWTWDLAHPPRMPLTLALARWAEVKTSGSMVWRRCHPRERGRFKAFLRPLLNDATDDKSSAAVRGSCPSLASPDKTTQTYSTLELGTWNTEPWKWNLEEGNWVRNQRDLGTRPNWEFGGNWESVSEGNWKTLETTLSNMRYLIQNVLTMCLLKPTLLGFGVACNVLK